MYAIYMVHPDFLARVLIHAHTHLSNLLPQLLSMLQSQQENAHNVKLEWIVIVLILVSVLLECLTVLGKLMGWWK